MGLKCRLLGHQYGDPEIERDREEKGDEVVVTIREIQVCQQCGAEHVVSENKEVTAIRSAQEVGLDQRSGAAPEAADPAAADDAPAGPETAPVDDPGAHIPEAEPETDAPNPFSPEAAGETPEAVDASDAASEPEADSDAGSDSESFNDDDFEPPSDPDEDDAVILGDEDTERDETQWPEDAGTDPAAAAQESAAQESAARESTPGSTARESTAREPTADGQPVSTDPPAEDDEPITDDAEFIDADEEAADSADVDRGHGEWPERTDVEERQPSWPVHEGEDEGFDAAPSDGTPAEMSFGGLAPETNGQTADGRDRAESQGASQTDVPDDRVEFYCPNCGHARGAGASSMRAGDICPECRQGYIAERRV